MGNLKSESTSIKGLAVASLNNEDSSESSKKKSSTKSSKKKKKAKSPDDKIRESLKTLVSAELEGSISSGNDEDEEDSSYDSVIGSDSFVEQDQELPIEEDQKIEKDMVILPYDKCLRCTHLVGERNGKKAFTKCHFSNGNELCPARYLVIVKGLPIEATAAKLAKLYIQGSPDSLKEVHKIHTKLLSTYDDVILQQVVEKQLEFVQNPILLDSFLEK